jgi:hypothetical protein
MRRKARRNYLHAGLVPVMAEADDDESFFFGKDGLIHGPS